MHENLHPQKLTAIIIMVYTIIKLEYKGFMHGMTCGEPYLILWATAISVGRIIYDA